MQKRGCIKTLNRIKNEINQNYRKKIIVLQNIICNLNCNKKLYGYLKNNNINKKNKSLKTTNISILHFHFPVQFSFLISGV